jgi:hypothetical protein
MLDMRKYLAVAVIPLLVSCGGAKAEPGSGPTKVVKVTASPSTSPTPIADTGTGDSGISKLGAEWQSPDGAVVVNVLEVRQDAPGNTETLDKGMHWAAVLSRVCVPAGGERVAVNQVPWSATERDGGFYESAGGPDYDRLNPLYPVSSATVFAGRCAEGWVYFEVPVGAKIAATIYSPDDSDPSTTHAWLLVRP